MQSPGRKSLLDGHGMNHSGLEWSTEGEEGKDAVMCSFRGPTSVLALPEPSLSFLSPFSSPGRLSNQEEMLGLSQCRPEDQMCGLEVVRQRRNGNQI